LIYIDHSVLKLEKCILTGNLIYIHRFSRQNTLLGYPKLETIDI